jgi:hypothetical protein
VRVLKLLKKMIVFRDLSTIDLSFKNMDVSAAN